MGRWIRFFLVMAIGLAAGLYYGWVINPVKIVDTTPDTLRVDYQADYVLMVAEAYQAEGDLALAARRLAILGDTPPLNIVQAVIQYAEQTGYSQSDLSLLAALQGDFQTWNPPPEALEP